MCGIAGALAREPDGRAPEGAVELAAAAMVHRGPDGFGFFHHGPVALAHRRLSIIDLSDAGRQPMTNEDGHDRHRGQRRDLQPRRAARRSGSQGPPLPQRAATSEVVAHLYEELGDAHARAAARHVRVCGVGRAHRDAAAGARPLRREAAVLLRPRATASCSRPSSRRCSRTRGRRREVDRCEALDAYLALQYVPAPDTIFTRRQEAAAGPHAASCAGRAAGRCAVLRGRAHAPELRGDRRATRRRARVRARPSRKRCACG